MAVEQQKPRIVDDPQIKEIYTNKTIGVSYDGGTVGLTFGCTRVLPDRLDAPPRQDEPPSVYVTGRMALSPSAAVELANALNGILADIAKKQSGPPGKPN